MKKLEECKAYFQDVYADWLDNRDKFGSELDRYLIIFETLKFIYGTDFETVEPHWREEALDEYYGALAKKTAD